MPDFEIRYFNADGTLGLVRMTTHETLNEAEAHAKQHQEHHARYEVREVGASRRS